VQCVGFKMLIGQYSSTSADIQPRTQSRLGRLATSREICPTRWRQQLLWV